MGTMASQITSLTIIYSTVYSGADQRKHQSSASLAFVREIHRWPVNSTHKGPVTRKMFPFDDVIVNERLLSQFQGYNRIIGSLGSRWNKQKHNKRVPRTSFLCCIIPQLWMVHVFGIVNGKILLIEL